MLNRATKSAKKMRPAILYSNLQIKPSARMMLLTLCASCLFSVQATMSVNDSQESSEKLVFNQDFFKDAPHWQVSDALTVEGTEFSIGELGSGHIILTPKDVNTDFEDTSSHIMSAPYFSDKIVSFEFMLSSDGMSDALLMGRYPVRLSKGSGNKASFDSPGAVGQFWDEWNKDNSRRQWGGSLPLQALELAPYQWHHFEAQFRAPRHDEGHNKVENAFIISVKINGELVQENVIAESPARNATFHWEELNGPLVFDAISGQSAVRNVLVSRADFSNIVLPENSGEATNAEELINFVEVGKSAFKNYGCAECHSVKADDPSVKTGPNLYGLFTRDPRKRGVQNQEKHEYEVRADLNYLKRSIRNAEAELALVESGAKAGEAYLPIMPRYTTQVIPDKDISAIYSFLLARNDLWNQGTVVQLESAEGPQEYDPMTDPMQFLVQDRIRIQRGPLPEVSGRAINVGHPNGLHYSFDPRSLSIAKIWKGGFLETSGELSGRGGKAFDIGYQAIETNLGSFSGLIRPLNAAGKLIDFSFKSPVFDDIETVKQSAYSEKSFEQRANEQDARFKGYFRDSTKPLAPVTFFYNISGNDIAITHEFTQNGDVTIILEGQINDEQRFAINQDLLKNIKLEGASLDANHIVLSKGLNRQAILTASITVAETPWLAPDKRFDYENQTFESEQATANLPNGYAIENWYAPKDNAGRQQLFEAMGIDTTKDGQVLVSTRTAGVWRLKDDKWQLFAEGIFDSLGMLSESDDGSVAVVGNKAELTRIKDINGDGIADQFETLFDSFTNAANYHTYVHGPTRDVQGNYVLTLNLADGKSAIYNAGGNVMGSHGGYVGWAVRISPEGKYEYFANGLRSPAGLGADPSGQVWYADNQGDFVGSSKIFMLEDGKFYGHPAGLIDEPNMTPDSHEVSWEAVIPRKEKAAVVVAHGKVANSLGNPVWDTTGGAFGPFAGQMIIGDQTQSNLTRTVFEKVNGQWQGVMIPFASGMESGVMRPVFLPDNSLLLGQTGRGWQAKGGNPAALQRISYDGTTVDLHIKNVRITEDGFKVYLTKALPPELAADIATLKQSVSINSWTYRDAPAYGSEEMGAKNDAIKSIVLGNDNTVVNISLEQASIPKVHEQQTGRVFHINLEHGSIAEHGKQADLHAFYSAHAFREND
ncbi:hypothetical protein PN836_018505 [Ningiella sp. W23]|uniref:hypothetical protein n=1 Tax=Ningiella sp. W23 TaxID=3023715 RepID=UPI0039F4ED2F